MIKVIWNKTKTKISHNIQVSVLVQLTLFVVPVHFFLFRNMFSSKVYRRRSSLVEQINNEVILSLWTKKDGPESFEALATNSFF